MPDTKTKTPEPLKGSVDTATDRERARLLDEDEVEALVAKAEADALEEDQ